MTFEGSWDITLHAPQGKQTARLDLLGGDAPGGTMTTDEGSTDLREYAVDGDIATWKVSITRPMPLTLTFRACVEGDTISGDAKVNAFIKVPFDGARVR
ncbi:hypothetical protein [Streptomyces sp. NPDC056296]|uniref:hypothetical protein n=1 Tax=Streptomyces sp. NPDC056296 TaxID=3345775 RepID=UPI0035DAD90C